MKQTNVLVKQLYPKIANKLNTNTNKFKQLVGRFIDQRAKSLYDIGPFDRITFTITDVQEFYKTIGIGESEINAILSQTYYYPMANFNPRAAKDPLTVAMIMVIRYFLLNKKDKELDLAIIYLSFSGKFYPSIHSHQFKIPPSENRHVMEYVINNELTQQFDLKREKTLIGAIKSRGETWVQSYKDRFKTCDDEDVVYLIQQLHDRLKSFIKNIAAPFYKVYDDKDHYLTYDSDSLDQGDYHIADNDSLKIERATEKALNAINTSTIDYRLCKISSDANVKTDEVKTIIESVLLDSKNLPTVKELIRLMVTDFYMNSGSQDIHDVKFLSFAITPKPNTKDAGVLRQKEIIEKWLMEGSPAYRRRRSRAATQNSYTRSIRSYFALTIYNANK